MVEDWHTRCMSKATSSTHNSLCFLKFSAVLRMSIITSGVSIARYLAGGGVCYSANCCSVSICHQGKMWQTNCQQQQFLHFAQGPNFGLEKWYTLNFLNNPQIANCTRSFIYNVYTQHKSVTCIFKACDCSSQIFTTKSCLSSRMVLFRVHQILIGCL